MQRLSEELVLPVLLENTSTESTKQHLGKRPA
jgi:hypothetical protein